MFLLREHQGIVLLDQLSVSDTACLTIWFWLGICKRKTWSSWFDEQQLFIHDSSNQFMAMYECNFLPSRTRKRPLPLWWRVPVRPPLPGGTTLVPPSPGVSRRPCRGSSVSMCHRLGYSTTGIWPGTSNRSVLSPYCSVIHPRGPQSGAAVHSARLSPLGVPGT